MEKVSSFASRSKWKEAESCFEVVDGVVNLLASLHMIRSYSHEAISLLSCLHQIWGQGQAEIPPSQISAGSGLY